MDVLIRTINNLERGFITLSMLTMVILIFVQVFSRYVMGSAIGWTEEAARYLFIWLIFLSIGIAFVEKKHISIDLLLDRLPNPLQKALQLFVLFFVALLLVFLLIQGIDLIETMRKFQQKSATLQLPMWLVYAALPVGFFFALIRIIQASFSLLTTTQQKDRSI